MKFFVYLLRCADDTLYCGYTTDVARRVAVHNAGKGAKYTRSRLPVVCVYHEEFATRNEALAREAAIKNYSRAQKLALLQKS